MSNKTKLRIMIIFANVVLISLFAFLFIPGYGVDHENIQRDPEAKVASSFFLRDVINGGTSNLVGLDLKISGKHYMTHYKYKLGMAGSTDCSVSTGYSQSITRDQKLVEDISVYPDGKMALCIIGQRLNNSFVISEQQLAKASTYYWQKDTVHTAGRIPKALIADAGFRKEITSGESNITNVDFKVQTHLGATHYSYKIGSASATDCSSSEGYSEIIPKSQDLLNLNLSSISENDIVLCLIGVKAEDGVVLYKQMLSDASVYQWKRAAH